MASVRGIVGLAFLAAIGVTLLVLGCALETYSNWYPMFVLICYVLCPIPSLIARRSEVEAANLLNEICLFITAFIVTSAYGLPFILARAPADHPVIKWGAAGLVMAGNTVVFLTILGFFLLFSGDDGFSYSSWTDAILILFCLLATLCKLLYVFRF